MSNQHGRVPLPSTGSGQTGSFQYDSVNRLTRRTLANGDYFQFDWTEPDGRKRGNLVSKTLNSSAGTTLSTEALYTWTEDNLLLRADTPNVGYSDYLYDAGGDRIHKLNSLGTETYYAFNGLGVTYEEEITQEGTTKRYYIHALGRHVASVEIDDLGAEKTYFFHADYLGSVRMISDDNALVVWQKRYTPFGGDEEQSGTFENSYQFTGKGWDADAGLFYFNAWWYDADVGRFISEDPLWGNIGDSQSLNRFAYGRNNPYRYTDPTGMEYKSGEEFANEIWGEGLDDLYDDTEQDTWAGSTNDSEWAEWVTNIERGFREAEIEYNLVELEELLEKLRKEGIQPQDLVLLGEKYKAALAVIAAGTGIAIESAEVIAIGLESGNPELVAGGIFGFAWGTAKIGAAGYYLYKVETDPNY